jgi:hypothetical protein
MWSGSESAAALAGRLCGGGVGVGTAVSAARRIDVGDEADDNEADEDDGVVGACRAERGDGKTATLDTVDDGAAELRLLAALARGDAVTKADMGRRKPPGAGDENGACTVAADCDCACACDMDMDSCRAATVALALAGEAKRAANAAVRADRGVANDEAAVALELPVDGGAAGSGSTTCTTVKSPAGTTGAVSLSASARSLPADELPAEWAEFGMRSGVRSSVTAATLAHAAHR